MKQIIIKMALSLCDKYHLVLKLNFIHTPIFMELIFFFWTTTLCSQILTVTHTYFFSTYTEIGTV